ncbi:MAG: hypothetical protein MUF02_09770, partial [Acidobacteria bacterium]|nr:hypothetical protein [Acidobacteriota bacterium]
MKKLILATVVIALALPQLPEGAEKKSPDAKPLAIGALLHGFKLEQKQFVKELDGECYLFRHVKSGARLLKVVSKD